MICFVRLEEEVVASCDTRRGREGRKVEGSACRVACLHYYTILLHLHPMAWCVRVSSFNAARLTNSAELLIN